MNNGEKPVANPYVILREEFDDWAVLFNCDTGRGFGLSPTGVYPWKLLDGEHSIHEMLKALHRDFREVPQEARTHIGAFVEELTSQGLATYAASQGNQERYRGTRQAGGTGHVEHGQYSPAKRNSFEYEPPRIVDLSSEWAIGTCCNAGAGANQGTCCINGTRTYAGACKTGTTTALSNSCQTGNTAAYTCAFTGLTAIGSMGCVSNGNVASGGFGCSNGGTVT